MRFMVAMNNLLVQTCCSKKILFFFYCDLTANPKADNFSVHLIENIFMQVFFQHMRMSMRSPGLTGYVDCVATCA